MSLLRRRGDLCIGLGIVQCINCHAKKYMIALSDVSDMNGLIQLDRVSHCCSHPDYHIIT